MTLTTLNGNTPTQLAETLERLTRRFGPAAAVRPAAEISEPPAVIPTGFPALDRALGLGGLPRGRIVDVFGPEASGKTTLCLHTIAQVQRQGGQALYIDAENGFDLAYALACGVDPRRLFIAQPDTADEALAIGGTALLVNRQWANALGQPRTTHHHRYQLGQPSAPPAWELPPADLLPPLPQLPAFDEQDDIVA